MIRTQSADVTSKSSSATTTTATATTTTAVPLTLSIANRKSSFYAKRANDWRKSIFKNV